MALINLPFNELVKNYGATHHWPMNTSTPADTEIIGGGDTPVAIVDRQGNSDADLVAQHGALTANGMPHYASQADGTNEFLEIRNIAQHVADFGWGDFTILLFQTMGSGATYWFVTTIGGTDYDGGPPASEASAYAVVFDSEAGEFRTYENATPRDTVAGVAGDLGTVYAYQYSSGDYPAIVGHFVLFNKALSDGDIAQLQEQRRFEGLVSGTATVDGAGSQAKIRAFSREGAHLAGKTTAASDGSYDLWVVEPGEVDLIATPPDGVDARPLAHGPINAVNSN